MGDGLSGLPPVAAPGNPPGNLPGNLMEWVAETPFIDAFLFLGAPALLLSIIGIAMIRLVYSRVDRQASLVGAAKVNYMAEVYAMVLGLFVVAAYESFQSLEQTVEGEALMLRALDQTFAGLPQAQAQPLREQLRSYAHLVVEEEWAAQTFGEYSPAAQAALDRLHRTLSALASGSETTQALPQAVSVAASAQLATIVRQRADRLAATPARDLSGLYSNVLIAVTVVALAMPWFVFAPYALMHMLLAAALISVFVALIVLAVHTLYPFAGNLTISPEPFERLLRMDDP